MVKETLLIMPTSTLNTGLLVALLIGLTGCGDAFFVRPPEGQLTADNFYNTEQDLRMATGALYNVAWFDYNDKASFCVGDAMAGNMITTDNGYEQFVVFSITPANDRLNEAWRSLYIVINYANVTINNIRNNSSDQIPEEAKLQAIAEARFIRGYAYSYLVQLWGPVPIITNTARLIEQPDVRRHRAEDVYQFVINDFKFAVEQLPPVAEQEGRVTQWSAKGMLARMFMARAAFRGNGSFNEEDLNKAKMYARDVIENSGISLEENYADLFVFENEAEIEEDLFALRWTYEGNTWGTQNSVQSYLAAEPALTGVGTGWGGGTGASYWLLQQYPPDGERRKPTFMIDGDHYPQLLQAEGGYTYTNDGSSGLTASAIKKYVIGTPADNGGKVAFMRTGIDTYMLRLAEVYLIYAQAILGNQATTSNPEALRYYNAVRTRAGLEPKSSITFMDIFMEKWKETAYEGRNWFQLVQWHYYEPNAAVEFVNNQDRNAQWEHAAGADTTVSDRPPSPITATHDDFSFPYPEADVSQNPNLMKEPVPYDFSQQGLSSGGEAKED